MNPDALLWLTALLQLVIAVLAIRIALTNRPQAMWVAIGGVGAIAALLRAVDVTRLAIGGTEPATSALSQLVATLMVLISLQAARRLFEHLSVARREARASEQRLQSIVETARSGILTLSGEGHITFANQALCEMLGYTNEEFIGLPSLGLVAAEHRDAARTLWRSRFEDGDAPAPHRSCWLHKSGAEVWVDVALSFLPLPDGGVGELAEVRDVTAEVEAERRSQMSEMKYRTVFESSQAGLFELDSMGRLTEANNRVAEILGYESATELLSKGADSFDRFVDPTEQVQFDDLIQAAGRVDDYELPRVKKDGSIAWIRLSAVLDRHSDSIRGVVVDVTEQRQLETQLHDREEQLRAILQTVESGIQIVNADGDVLFANRALSQMFGYGEEEFASLNGDHHIPADDLSAVRQRRSARLSGGDVPSTYRAVRLRKDGSEIWVDVAASTLALPDGGTGILTEIRDVTDEHRATKNLEHSEERYRQIFQSIPAGVVRVRIRDGAVLESNNFLAARLGYGSMWEIPEALEALIEASDRVADALTAGLHATELETSFTAHDGATVVVRVDVQIFPEQDVYILLFADVTEARASEMAIRESEARYRDLFETSQNGILIISPNRRITFANDSASRLFGYDMDELIGLRSEVLVADGEDDRLTEWNQSRLSGKSAPTRYRGRRRRKDGTIVDVDVSISSLKRDGEVVRTRVEYRDVTEENKLRDQLNRTQKLDALGTLVAGVAHDFNNLLTGIRGGIELAIEDLGESRWLNSSLGAADRADTLVRQLQQFSRDAAGVRELIDLSNVVREAVDLASETFDRRIDVTVSVPDAPVHVLADGSQIHQVIMNLLINARDATLQRADDDGGDYHPRVAVTVCSGKGTGGDAFADVEVADNGTGIAPGIRDRIFDPFFTTKGLGGTGLGLSTSYGIITNHGGDLDVMAGPDGGSIFTFRVPLPPRDPEETTSLTLEARSDDLVPDASVLVVDDELAVLEFAQAVLATSGYSVTTAAGGNHGVAIAAERAMDLVILDVDMPAPNGWQALTALRANDPDQRVIMISGSETAHRARKCRADFLRKPFSKVELLRAVGSALRAPAAS